MTQLQRIACFQFIASSNFGSMKEPLQEDSCYGLSVSPERDRERKSNLST
jgi:hypothetical protein